MPKVKHPVYVYIKKFPVDDQPAEIVEKMVIRAANLSASHIERLERGITRNLDTENYYVDTTEADAAVEARKKT